MKAKLLLCIIALTIAGWCNATSYATLTLYADGCGSANTIKCDVGQQVKVTAVPMNGHRHFVRWSDGSTDKPRTIVVSQNITFRAIFAIDRHTISASAENGSVEGTGEYDYGTDITLTAIPNEHYYFSQWSDGNTDNPRSLTVTRNVNLKAVCAPYQYTLSATAVNGHIEGAGKYAYGTTATLTAVADEHYHFTKWSDGNTDNPRTVSVDGDATYTAEFAINRYTLIVTADGNGSVQGADTYNYGTTVTLTAVANEHYHFARWSDGNTDNPRTIVMSKNITLRAIFAIDRHTISVSAENGKIEGAGVYNYGTTATLTAVANEHYHFTQWSDGNTDNPRTVSVDGDATYTAVFAPNQYTISTSAKNGRVEGAGKFDYGTTATLTAIANEHYHFAQWSDGNTDNPRTITIESDATYTAEFAIDQFTITVTCDILQGVVSGGGVFEYGMQASVQAFPNSGYEFKQWSNGQSYNPYRFAVVSDLTLKAEFVPATAIDDTQADNDTTTPRKVLFNGQVYILRNGKTYTLTGVEVK